MEGDWRKLFNRDLVSIIICLFVLGSLVPLAFGEEEDKTGWGISLLGGFNARNEPHIMSFAILPRWDLSLHKHWNVELEGNFSYYNISDNKDLYVLGCNGNLILKPYRWKKGSLSAIGGVGLGYNNGNGALREIGDSHVAGTLQVGSRINYKIGKRWWLHGEYRFHHISDPFDSGDVGINTHNFVLGVSF